MPLLRGLGQSPSCDGRPQRRFHAVPRLDAILKDRASRQARCGQGNAIHLAATALGKTYREARDQLAGELHLLSRNHPPLARR